MAAKQQGWASTEALALTELDLDEGDESNMSTFITEYFADSTSLSKLHTQLHYSAEEHHLVLNTTPSLPLVLPDPHKLTLEEEDNVANMLLTGCGCSLGKDGQCFCRQFTDDYIMAVQGKSCERAHTELDMFLMGELRAVLNTTADTMHAIWRATKNE